MAWAATENLYQILQVQPDASFDAIKKAYRKLAKQYHPDIAGNSEANEARFKRITHAYKILSNPASRQSYHYTFFFSKYTQETTLVTAATMVAHAQKILQYLKITGHYQLNYDTILVEIQKCINQENVDLFKSDTDKLYQFCVAIQSVLQALPYQQALPYYTILANMIRQNASFSAMSAKKMQHRHYMLHLWLRVKFLLVCLLVLLACWFCAYYL